MRLILILSVVVSSSVFAESFIRDEDVGNPVLPDTSPTLEKNYNLFQDEDQVVDPSFIGYHLNLTGCGKSTPHFGTLVTGKFFVGTFHGFPDLDDKVRFFPTKDMDDHIDRYVKNRVELRRYNSDMGIGELKLQNGSDGSLGSNVAFYPIVVQPPSVVGKSLWMMGQAYVKNNIGHDDGSFRSNGAHSSQKLGKNVVALFANSSELWTYYYGNPSQPHEFMARHSSSGAPSFIPFQWPGPPSSSVRTGTWGAGDNLCLVGTHKDGDLTPWNLPTPNNSWGDDINVGNYWPEILARILLLQNGVPEHKLQLPISITSVPGDFNADLIDDDKDIDILAREVRNNLDGDNRGFCWYLDWDLDNNMDMDDVEAYVVERGWKMGDANRSGLVDFDDFLIVFANANQGTGFGWADGDFNGDGQVTSADNDIMMANWDG